MHIYIYICIYIYIYIYTHIYYIYYNVKNSAFVNVVGPQVFKRIYVFIFSKNYKKSFLLFYLFYYTALTCDPNGIPLSSRQWQKCDNGYRWGSSCSLGCYDGYPLVGPSTVTCDATSSTPPQAYWNWNDEEPSFCLSLYSYLLT